MKKTLSFIVTALLIVSTGLFIFLFIQHFYLEPTYKTVDVKKGVIKDEVYAMGRVESVSDAYLYFKNPGKITSINVRVGDSVQVGDILASQDPKDVRSQVTEINAGINVQKARINQLKAGSSQEEIDIAATLVSNAKINVSNAETSLKNARQSSVDSLKNVFTSVDDLIRNTIDQMFINPKSSNPKLIFSAGSDFGLGLTVESGRIIIEKVLQDLNSRSSNVTIDSDISSDITYTKKQLTLIKQFLEKLSLLTNNSINKPTEVSQITWDGWRNNVALGRSSIDSMYSNLTVAETSINNAESAVKAYNGALKNANEQLILKKTATRSTDLAVYEAQLAQAAAARSKVDALKQDLVISSPISGLISEVNSKVGELSGPEKVLFTVLSLDNLQIKLNIVENNITKVKVGQVTSIAFDAMPDKRFNGVVTAIDPAETEINGTVYYKTTVTLNKKEDFIRSGMTANVWVTASTSENTLFVPISVIYKNDSKTFVKVLENNKVVDVEVITGIKDSKGNIEILSGVTEGQKVIIETI
jgi:RND family efflux transporter MFP subunit